MFVKQKQLLSTCRACGNQNQLDSMSRAGAYLMKVDLKGQSEIDANGGTSGSKKGKGDQKEEAKEEEEPESQPTEDTVEK